jgi:hypothetical protein
MKTIFITLIGATLPAYADPDWLVIERSRKVKLAHETEVKWRSIRMPPETVFRRRPESRWIYSINHRRKMQ